MEMIGMVTFRYGEIININLVRDKKSGKSKGYGFIAYEDQRSTVLAVDNFNGIKVSFSAFHIGSSPVQMLHPQNLQILLYGQSSLCDSI